MDKRNTKVRTGIGREELEPLVAAGLTMTRHVSVASERRLRCTKCRAEAAKCVLLCANCHAELEVGAVDLPVKSGSPAAVQAPDLD